MVMMMKMVSPLFGMGHQCLQFLEHTIYGVTEFQPHPGSKVLH